MVIGNLKGRPEETCRTATFGSPDPEGYRKALRCMKIAKNWPPSSPFSISPARFRVSRGRARQGEAIAAQPRRDVAAEGSGPSLSITGEAASVRRALARVVGCGPV